MHLLPILSIGIAHKAHRRRKLPSPIHGHMSRPAIMDTGSRISSRAKQTLVQRPTNSQDPGLQCWPTTWTSRSQFSMPSRNNTFHNRERVPFQKGVSQTAFEKLSGRNREQKTLLTEPVNGGVNDTGFTRRADELRQKCWGESKGEVGQSVLPAPDTSLTGQSMLCF